MPDWAYEPAGRGLSGLFAGDDWECAGSLAELADGSVLWIPRASGRAAVFRVRGWENWFRASGKIELEPSADYRGDGTAGAVTVGSVPSVSDGLAAAYLLDEAQGRTIHDSVGDAHTKFEVFMNPPVPRWQSTGGIRGGAMEFSEPGIRVNRPGAKIAGDFTVAFWLRTKQATQPVMQGSFDLILKDGHPRIDFGGWPMSAPQDTPRLDDGQWHHVAFVWNQSGGKRAMHLFLDGQPAATGNGPANGSTDKFSLGVSNHLQGQPFIGAFDKTLIYQRSLPAEEVAALAQRNAR